MKWKEGTPDIMSFGLGDVHTPILKFMQNFIKHCIEDVPPKLALPYAHTTGDAWWDGMRWEGQQPDDPLTLRLYLGSFLPDDGTSMIYETTLGEMIQQSFERNPTPETMQAVLEAMEKQMRVIKDYIADYKEPVDEDDDEE